MSESTPGPSSGKRPRANREVQTSSLLELLNEQDASMRALFAKALNLYVAPGADAASDKEKRDRLKQAVEDSIQEDA